MFFLIWNLSWLSGYFTILVSAFFLYDEFGIVDAMTFLVFMLTGATILVLVYYPFLKIMERRSIPQHRITYPFLLTTVANIPIYILIVLNGGEFYQAIETWLFAGAFVVFGLVFGGFWWMGKVKNQNSKPKVEKILLI